MKKTLLQICIIASLTLCACKPAAVDELSTQYATISVDGNGFITQIKDNESGINYLAKEGSSPIISLYDGEQYIEPTGLRAEGDKWIVDFANQSEAVITKEEKDGYIRLQLESLSNRDNIEAIAWGPYATTISKYIGETVGVVHDTAFAIGVHPLQIGTTEGRPHLGDDAVGNCYVEALPGKTLPDEVKDLDGQTVPFPNVNVDGDMPDYVRMVRGNAAVKRPYGSDLQFFARDWRKDKVIDYYGRKQFVSAWDQDYIGSAIALFATPKSDVIDVIGKIEVTEGLPHPEINGVWIKKQQHPNPAYMLYDGNNLDMALNYADSCNFDLIHIGDIFKSWGHFDLHTSRFPGGAEQIKDFTDKAHKRGKRIGVHTLTMFTSTNDPHVSPVPSDSLAFAGSSRLSKPVSIDATEIEIDEPDYFHYLGETRSAKIGKEIISYSGVSDEAPYRLLNCARGQFGTKAAKHSAGEKIEKLVNNCYSGFYPDMNLRSKYAKRLAEVCNETGIDLMDFDGFIDQSPTGHGVMGGSAFLQEWHSNLDRTIISCGASPFHYWWHTNWFYNWGEPWYDNLRQSQVNYRLENQKYFERNLIPGMLGWFKLEQTYRPEDIEWIQARSAAFDAGYLLRVDESIEKNGFKGQLFEAIRSWQDLRNKHLLTAEQREKMKDPTREFHLSKTGDNSWELCEVKLQSGNRHKFRMVQTGEPLLSKYTFDNPYDKQPVAFYCNILPGEDADSHISNLKLTVEGCAPIEVPMALKAGDRLYSDGKNVYVCDEYWTPKATYPLPATALWNKGENAVRIECDFSSEKAPVVDFEFKSAGNRETING